MNFLTKLKPISMVLVAVIVLSGCSTNNKSDQKESQTTQINQVASSSTQSNNTQINQVTSSSTQSNNTQISQATSSSNQPKDTQRKSESNLFGDISDYQIDNPETYHDDKFSVEYPSAWKASKPNDETDTVTPDGDPERGISISVDKKEFYKREENVYLNSIYVYHAVSHIDFSLFEDKVTKEVFTTTENVNGELSYAKRKGYLYIYLTLGEGAFYGAQIRVSEDLFNKYKEQIYGILKSIKVTDPNSL